MSRAFVREDTDAPPPPPLPRPVSAAPNWVTKRGLDLIDDAIRQLENDLAQLTPGNDEEGSKAAALRRDLDYWRIRRSTATLVEAGTNPETVSFGTRARIIRDGTPLAIAIVGEDEADPGEGRIAWTAPFAKALQEAEVGETVVFKAGNRNQEIEILEIAPYNGDLNRTD